MACAWRCNRSDEVRPCYFAEEHRRHFPPQSADVLKPPSTLSRTHTAIQQGWRIFLSSLRSRKLILILSKLPFSRVTQPITIRVIILLP
jgi:hypothetical protein